MQEILQKRPDTGRLNWKNLHKRFGSPFRNEVDIIINIIVWYEVKYASSVVACLFCIVLAKMTHQENKLTSSNFNFVFPVPDIQYRTCARHRIDSYEYYILSRIYYSFLILWNMTKDRNMKGSNL